MNKKFLTAAVAVLWLGGCAAGDARYADDPYSAMTARLRVACTGTDLAMAPDVDGDGFGDISADPQCKAAPSVGFTDNIADCDDDNPLIFPGASEVTNFEDDNCNGKADEVPGADICYVDADDDNHRDTAGLTFPSTGKAGCNDPGEAWFTTPLGDCLDTNKLVNVDRAEIDLDKLDNNCNGVIDETGQVWYEDKDGDGHGNSKVSQVAAVQPVGFVSSSSAADCNDLDKLVFPGAPELCNGKDDDCDNAPDDGTGSQTWYPDADADTYGVTLGQIQGCALLPPGFSSLPSDCNDGDKAVNPGATEVCDTKDNNCNGTVDEAGSATTSYADADKDTFGNPGAPTTACVVPPGNVSNASDCNDTDAAQNPLAVEVPGDNKDQNCNGSETCFVDNDDDGVRPDLTSTVASTNTSCLDSKEAVAADPTGDCDDNNNLTRPGATEVCDTKDNDCDSQIDEGVGATWFGDADKDTYGNATAQTVACVQPVGTVADNKDCDDTDANRNPGKAEVCDAKDNNCDGQVDNGATGTTTWYLDGDNDTFGLSTSTSVACLRPAGFATQGGDCKDDNKLVFPTATEVCNGIDDDCDAAVDENGGTTAWYRDADGDMHGSPYQFTFSCVAPVGYANNASDCNDASAAQKPGVTELVGDNVDQNCDGSEICYVDEDNDNWRLASTITKASVDTDCLDSGEAVTSDSSVDCDDRYGSINGGMIEIVNGYDDNCDGTIDNVVRTDGRTLVTVTVKSDASAATMDREIWWDVLETTDDLGWYGEANKVFVPAGTQDAVLSMYMKVGDRYLLNGSRGANAWQVEFGRFEYLTSVREWTSSYQSISTGAFTSGFDCLHTQDTLVMEPRTTSTSNALVCTY